MIKGFDCGKAGEQWDKQQRYIAEIKEEWKEGKRKICAI